jgi:hypothetical protein
MSDPDRNSAGDGMDELESFLRELVDDTCVVVRESDTWIAVEPRSAHAVPLALWDLGNPASPLLLVEHFLFHQLDVEELRQVIASIAASRVRFRGSGRWFNLRVLEVRADDRWYASEGVRGRPDHPWETDPRPWSDI